MSQVNSPQVPSGSGLSVREGINAVLAALMSSNSGPSEPANPIPFQIWGDTASNDLKIRNTSNTAWVLLSDFIGALEYDRAQVLTEAQKVMARANIGAAKAIAITPVSAPNDVRFYVDFTTANGEVWRYISGSIVKQASSSSDYVVTYGFNFISQTLPVVSCGDATSGNYYCLTYNNLAGSTTITARNDTGAQVLGVYRANWTVFGRIL